MGLSPEERRRIYEEERAKLEGERSTGLKPNVAGLLCYLGVWVTGIIFLIIERKDRWVRFQAMQSLITFGILGIILAIADTVRHWVSFWAATPIAWLAYPQALAANIIFGVFMTISIVIWLVMMHQTYHGRLVKLAIFGDLAERAIARLDGTSLEDLRATAETKTTEAKTAEAREPGPEPASPFQSIPGARIRRERHFRGTRGARIAASAAAIGWSTFFLIFFNFFGRYFAVYSREMVNGVATWHIYPMLTPALAQVLPILNITLIASIAGHAVAIAVDRYRVRAVILITLACLGMVTVLTFLRVFPFDFSVIPDAGVAAAMPTVAVVVMVIITVGLGISALVRFIRLMISLNRNRATPPA